MFFNTKSMNKLDEVPQNSTYTVKLVGGYPNGVDWYFWEGMNFFDPPGGTSANPADYERSPMISPDGEVGIAPRYDDYYLHMAYPTIRNGYMRFDYNMSKGMYYSEWNYVVGNAKSVKLVLLDSWNEYHERTAIEPHTDLTTGYFSGVGGTSCLARLLNAAVVETTTTATSATSSSRGGGGIPEFLYLPLAGVLLASVVVLSYFVARHRARHASKDVSTHPTVPWQGQPGPARSRSYLLRLRERAPGMPDWSF